MKEVYDFLKKAETYYLATIDGNRPRVRPFGTINIFEDKLYIQTGRKKNVSKQIMKNPHIEICAMLGDKWIRIEATAVDDKRVEPKESLLANYPRLLKMYDAEDENTQVFYLKNATATIYSYTGQPQEIKF
jgi:uncharacterized pyridoxamine 5'-phosphate oxidase family protein